MPAFSDHRYAKVEGKPVFLIYEPKKLPEPLRTTDLWRTLAREAGLPGLFLVAVASAPWRSCDYGFDAATPRTLSFQSFWGGAVRRRLRQLLNRVRGLPNRVVRYADAISFLTQAEGVRPDVFPCVIPNWDNTPRCGRRGLVLHNSTPELFGRHLRTVLAQTAGKPQDKQVVFIKSWNEWAEGNHLEPDLRFGRRYLEALREEVARASGGAPVARAGR